MGNSDLQVTTHLNALAANTITARVVDAILEHKPMAHLGGEGVRKILTSFNDAHIIEMAQLVMTRAEKNNLNSLAKLAKRRGPKAQMKLTIARIEQGLISNAQKFLKTGVAQNPAETAKAIRTPPAL